MIQLTFHSIFENLFTDSSWELTSISAEAFFHCRDCLSNISIALVTQKEKEKDVFIIFLWKPVFCADDDKNQTQKNHRAWKMQKVNRWNVEFGNKSKEIVMNLKMTCCELMLSNVLRAAPERNKFRRQSDIRRSRGRKKPRSSVHVQFVRKQEKTSGHYLH